MNKNVKVVVKEALICALYVALTLSLNFISYGMIQFRVSEILILLCFYDKKHIIGLTLGVVIANCFSPMILFDITFGVCASILSLICVNKIKPMYLGAIFPVVINAIIVGTELYLAFSAANPLIINMLWVGLGELVVMIAGVIIFKVLERNKFIYEKILMGE